MTLKPSALTAIWVPIADAQQTKSLIKLAGVDAVKAIRDGVRRGTAGADRVLLQMRKPEGPMLVLGAILIGGRVFLGVVWSRDI
ncbi:hypothetical protein HYQ46_003708 [Verticillium longisporum]|nr:hypothetical protein HYQ46_003708 [Verticillium longisporum]